MRWVTIILLLVSGVLRAQVTTVQADTTVIRIGEQVTLTLGTSWDPGSGIPDIVWPVIGDTLSRNLEVVGVSDPDTATSADGSIRSTIRVRITSFDTGYWTIAPFEFTINGVQTETDPLLVEVRPTPLDESGSLRDIRDIHEVPFSLMHALLGLLPWLLGGLAVLIAILLIAKALRRRRSQARTSEKEAPPLPLHERVIAELQAVEAQRLWQAGDHKTYQARVTDILRGYIEERYTVPALERTTDELLKELRLSSMEQDQRIRLANMLRLADLVKFAKGIPSAVENERSMIEAIRFVQGTAARNGNVSGDATLAGSPVTPPTTPNDHAH